jgi:hypothetical protein
MHAELGGKWLVSGLRARIKQNWADRRQKTEMGREATKSAHGAGISLFFSFSFYFPFFSHFRFQIPLQILL